MKNLLVYLLITITWASASDLRISSLGGNAGFWPDDDQNIMMFPSTINNFNLAQIQDASGENPYATLIFGDDTKYGFMLDGSGDNLINVAYGKGDLGALIGFDMNSSNSWQYEYNNPNIQERNPSSMALNAMVGLDHSLGEIGFGINFSSSDNDNGSNDDDPGSLSITANFRREQPLWIFSHLLASANFGSGNGEQVITYDGTFDAYSDTIILDFSNLSVEASLFRHWEIASETDLMFAAGLGFGSSGIGPDSVKITLTSIIVPNYTFAVETNLREWATLRAGINNAHILSQSMKMEGSNQDLNSMGASETNYSVGLGLEYEGFKLDLDLNPGFLINPVNYITGNNLMDPLASKATITYSF
jgi:hypothetical protein